MNLFYLIIFFVFGLFVGSFYTVVGLRLPKGISFIWGHSRCDSCNHPLSFLDMIPIFSYLFLRGKCRYCHNEIPPLSTYMEIFTGVLFALSYYCFGISYNLLIALGVVSMLTILSITDMSYMIIPDEILIFYAGYFLIIITLKAGIFAAFTAIASGLLLFGVMYLIMIMGNFIFKKESLGGGDVKMMFIFGLVLDPIIGIISIFLGSVLALPFSLLLLMRKNQHLIPFGPFLLISFAILYFTQIKVSTILSFFRLFS